MILGKEKILKKLLLATNCSQPIELIGKTVQFTHKLEGEEICVCGMIIAYWFRNSPPYEIYLRTHIPSISKEGWYTSDTLCFTSSGTWQTRVYNDNKFILKEDFLRTNVEKIEFR